MAELFNFNNINMLFPIAIERKNLTEMTNLTIKHLPLSSLKGGIVSLYYKIIKTKIL